MKRYLERGAPVSNGKEEVKQLLEEKILHYELVARSLINDESSTQESDEIFNNPRSPIAINDTNVNNTHTSSTQSVEEHTVGSVDSTFVYTTTSQANTKLAYAIEFDEKGKFDEAVKAYIESSEIFLLALQSAESLYKAGHASVEPIVVNLKRRLTQTLDRVEQLKQKKNLVSQSTSRSKSHDADNFSTVSQQSHLTPAEIAILKKSSLIASGLFLPWSDKDSDQLRTETPQAFYRHIFRSFSLDPYAKPRSAERCSRRRECLTPLIFSRSED